LDGLLESVHASRGKKGDEMMSREHWLLCGGADDVPLEVATKLERLTSLADHHRVAAVQAIVRSMQIADRYNLTDIANASLAAGIQLADVAMPVVSLKVAGTA
jgi:hypothetical protein